MNTMKSTSQVNENILIYLTNKVQFLIYGARRYHGNHVFQKKRWSNPIKLFREKSPWQPFGSKVVQGIMMECKSLEKYRFTQLWIMFYSLGLGFHDIALTHSADGKKTANLSGFPLLFPCPFISNSSTYNAYVNPVKLSRLYAS